MENLLGAIGLGSNEQASAGHSASEATQSATDIRAYGWFDEYRKNNPGYQQVRLETSEYPEFTGALHTVELVKVKVSHDKTFVTWFFPELSTMGVEGETDVLVTLVTKGRTPGQFKTVGANPYQGAIRKTMLCLQGIRFIEQDDDFLYPELYSTIEQETGLTKDDLLNSEKFNRGEKNDLRVPSLMLNIIEHTDAEILKWFAIDKKFSVKELSGMRLQCKLSANRGSTWIMSKLGQSVARKSNTNKANVDLNNQQAVVVEDDF